MEGIQKVRLFIAELEIINRRAISSLKEYKSPGEDEIIAELI